MMMGFFRVFTFLGRSKSIPLQHFEMENYNINLVLLDSRLSWAQYSIMFPTITIEASNHPQIIDRLLTLTIEYPSKTHLVIAKKNETQLWNKMMRKTTIIKSSNKKSSQITDDNIARCHIVSPKKKSCLSSFFTI